MAVLGAGRQVTWSLTNAALLRNSASGSGGALAFTVPVQGVVCQHCILQDNTARLLGGALFSTAKELCVASRKQQVGVHGAVSACGTHEQGGQLELCTLQRSCAHCSVIASLVMAYADTWPPDSSLQCLPL